MPRLSTASTTMRTTPARASSTRSSLIMVADSVGSVRICPSSVENVEALAQLFAGLEIGHDLVRHRHLVPGARVAPDPLAPRPDRERAEAAKLDPVAARQSRADLLEHGGDDPLDVAHVEVRVRVGEPLDQIRFGHA